MLDKFRGCATILYMEMLIQILALVFCIALVCGTWLYIKPRLLKASVRIEPLPEDIELDGQAIDRTTMHVESLGGYGWTGRGEVLED